MMLRVGLAVRAIIVFAFISIVSDPSFAQPTPDSNRSECYTVCLMLAVDCVNQAAAATCPPPPKKHPPGCTSIDQYIQAATACARAMETCRQKCE
jgi:hypothetical protein